MELVRTLVVKYPYILSKDQEQLEATFSILEQKGVSRPEIVKLIFECPKLLSINLENQITECLHLFDLYHKISEEQVFDIFRHFPYLFCCEMSKMRLFLGEFRKYKFTND
jgi:hypothetical protein